MQCPCMSMQWLMMFYGSLNLLSCEGYNNSLPAVVTLFSASDYVGCFCVDDSNKPMHSPEWDKDASCAPGEMSI